MWGKPSIQQIGIQCAHPHSGRRNQVQVIGRQEAQVTCCLQRGVVVNALDQIPPVNTALVVRSATGTVNAELLLFRLRLRLRLHPNRTQTTEVIHSHGAREKPKQLPRQALENCLAKAMSCDIQDKLMLSF